MHELNQIIGEATAAIEHGYYSLEIDGGDAVYRERVYCYELYHQMRLRWPGNCQYCLNGEVDKAAHPILSRLGVGCAKPDLLVHHPGDMTRNYAIIEVKTATTSIRGIKKDLETMSLFVRRVLYRRAIYLIYGAAVGRQVQKIRRLASQMPDLAPIELWLHSVVGQAAVHEVTLSRGEVDGQP